jgi:predicted glycoside hydrolase/deacetylase ChbG (UPF0249 family)
MKCNSPVDSNSTKRLIVNADDYGWTAGISAGIRKAHSRGIVTSTTALANMPGAADELAAARRLCPQLGLGVHLNMSEGYPLLPPRYVRSLVGGDGRFHPPGRAMFAAHPEELRMELRAQIDHFSSAAGRPTHLDSHHHLTILMPRFAEVSAELACELGIPLRTISSTMARAAIDPHLAGFHDAIIQILDRLKVPRTDYCELGFDGWRANRETLAALLGNLRPGVTELVCHPGLDLKEPDPHVPPGRRRNELEVLIDPTIVDIVRKQNIELVNYTCIS